MATIIGLYPGQGSQEPQMALDLYAASASVKHIFALARDISHVHLYKLLTSATEAELKQTKNTQLVVTLASRAAEIRLLELGHHFTAHSGFSLGELAAYASGGILSDQSLFELINIRAGFMDQESKKIAEYLGELGMAAVIGLDFETVEHLVKSIEGLYASNDNSPTQVVIAGTLQAIGDAEALLKANGARRIIPLKVSGPFHTPLMEGAVPCFEEAISDLHFKDPSETIISSVDGKPITTAGEAKATLAAQLAKPVRWTKTIETIQSLVREETIVGEVGYGSVLTNLVKDRLACLPLGSEAAIHALEKGRTV